MPEVYVVDESLRLKRMANLIRGAQTVIDVGFADMPNEFLSNSNVIGVDLVSSEKPINYSSIYQGSLADYASMNTVQIDAIHAGEIIEHLEEPMTFFRECFETLAESGSLVLSTPNPNSFIERLLTLNLSRKYFYTSDHLILFPQRWLIRMLERVGFAEVKLYSGGFPVPGYGLIPFPRAWCHQTIAFATKR